MTLHPAPQLTHSDAILILGGGLMGLAFVAAGMLAPHAEGLSGALLELGQLSLERIPGWVTRIEADSGLSCGLRPCGIVVPFSTAAERDVYPTAAWGEALDRQGLERELPGIGPGWQAGLLFRQDGQIDNRRQLMRALERACVELGVRFQEGVDVLELLQEGDQRDAAATVQIVQASTAVLCSGAWSAQLLPQLPVFPVKGQMLSLQGPREALKRVIFGPGTYLVPREDGLLVVGATSEREAGFTEGLTPFGQRQLEAGIGSLLPQASQWPPMERWWGFRPCTPDEGPLLGKSPVQGLWLATGHHRNGVLLAAITADLLGACLSSDGGSAEQRALLEPFRWDRFSC